MRKNLCEDATIMLSVYTTLSWRYLRQRWVRASLIVLSIAAGVSMLVATRALNQTMARAAQVSANPMAGSVDLLVSNGDAPVDRDLAKEVAAVEGVAAARPRGQKEPITLAIVPRVTLGRVTVQPPGPKDPITLTRVGSVGAHGPAAALGGNLLVLDLPAAAAVAGLKPGQVTRIDVLLKPG